MITKPTIYTAEFVEKELEEIERIIDENKDIIVLGEVILSRGYSPQRFSEWEAKFDEKEYPVISESIKRVKAMLETRLNLGGLTGQLNPTLTIFNLKNNYGWKDKTETDITSGGDKLNGYNNLSADELRKLAKEA